MNQETSLLSLVDVVTVLPIIALFVASVIPLLLKVFRGNREGHPIVPIAFNFAGILMASLWTVSLSGAKTAAFNNAVVLDGVSIWMSYLVYLVTSIALMLAYENVATRGRQFTEFCFLMVSSAIGMLILMMSNDLIVTFIGIEVMSLCLYILVAMSKEEVLSKEAAFKYFVLGSFASAIFLFGISFIYGTVGSTYLPEVSKAVSTLFEAKNRLFILGTSLVVLGFAFKVSIFPLHAWTPDVYQGSPTPVTAFMATAVKAATFVAFLRFFRSEGFPEMTSLLTVATWMAVLTMFVGNAAAVIQDNFKRMLAYSSVAHSGYAMIGLITAGFGSNFGPAAGSLLFYLFSYSLMTLGAFALIAIFEKNENTSLSVSDLKGLAKKHPGLALSLSILMLSLAGIPPTLGFFGKFYVFSAAIEQDMYWLVFWGVINSVISVYYYLRPVVMMYMSDDEPAEVLNHLYASRMVVISMAVLIVVLGIAASPVLRAVQKSVTGLL